MNLDIYFKPIEKFEIKNNSIGSFCEFYEVNFPNWEEADIVVISVEQQHSFSDSLENEVFHISVRKKFYEFYLPQIKNVKLADLGIVEKGAQQKDTLIAIQDITAEVQKKGKFLIILGNSQELTFANYLGYKNIEQTVNVTCIDKKIDLETDQENSLSNSNFINHLLTTKPNFLFNFSILGSQQFYLSPAQLNLFDELYFDCLRLGELQQNLKLAEPYLRNTDILSIDLSCLRVSDYDSTDENGPNGFFANELCQLTRYAGISDKLTSFGVYNLRNNLSESEAELVAQLLYFAVDGFAKRKKDYPVGTKKDYTKYSVFHEELNHNLVFYKSPKTERWWLEVPYPPLKDFKFERHNLVPCDYEDYITAQKGLIPDLWWKTYRKLN